MNFILYAPIRIKLTPSELSRRHHNFVDGIIILLTQSEFVRSIRNVWLDPKKKTFKQGNRRPQLTVFASLWKDRSGARSDEVRAKVTFIVLFLLLSLLSRSILPCQS